MCFKILRSSWRVTTFSEILLFLLGKFGVSVKLTIKITVLVFLRPNKYLGVVSSRDNRKLWISGIPKSCSAQEVKVKEIRFS